MILYQNSIIRLDYEPATDILSVALPDMHSFTISEVERSFQLIVATIRSYDIKKMLLDSSKATVEVKDEAYRHLVLQFSQDLMQTRLQKVARVGTSDVKQERRATWIAEEIGQKGPHLLAFHNFSSKAAAMEWLLT